MGRRLNPGLPPDVTRRPLVYSADDHKKVNFKTLMEVVTTYVAPDTWEDVGVMQKWFAAGEAAAHLKYLEAKGSVQSAMEDGVTRYWA